MKQFNLTKIILSGLLAGAINTATAQTTFNYTGAVQTYVVPSGVTSLTIDAVGASGGYSYSGYGAQGKGGRVQCSMAVTAGQVLNFFVGGQGDNGVGTSGGVNGGWNGGGNSSVYNFGAGGGGATDIRYGGTALSNRVIVASAGGGGGYNCSSGNDGGNGGGLTGDTSSMCHSKSYSGLCYNALGGTQTAGGTGGTCGGSGTTGAAGVGGAGKNYGGGGGGGYYGGGGGYYAGGAGGSSYTDPTRVSGVTHTAAYNTLGHGHLVITAVCPLPTVAAITGTPTLCAPGGTTLADATPGGVWSSSSTSVATVSSGAVSGMSAGTAIISYAVTNSCGTTTVTDTVYVTAMPTIAAAITTSCGNTDTITASGGTTYTWYPASGLSCTSCATTEVNPSSTTTYTVMGTTMGCTNGTTITVNGDRIYGHINFSSLAPDTLDMKVWLIQYNPIDSSIKALDSVLTCTIDTTGYYEFNGKASGSYMVKAKMLFGSYAGASGYIPTYSSSSATWSTAATAAHGSGSDVLDITMIYGTVPAGPGFIGGNVYSGAGKGTSGETLYPGMLVYLKDAITKQILT
ncbi:MAG: C-terminal target protein, partial [Flavipsychrobacter sp.]|nr:C-terminal target protein [Flavipsychrobacter sp.]